MVILDILFKDGDYSVCYLQGYLDGLQVLLFHGLSLLVVTGFHARAIGLRRSYKENHQRIGIIAFISTDIKVYCYRRYEKCREKPTAYRIIAIIWTYGGCKND